MTKSTLPTFAVDKDGLAKLLERRGGKAFAITELIQNAWDEDSTEVTITLSQTANQRGRYTLTVEDNDPDGFTDLSHAYTLFAESEKKSDPTKRGRFNLGEKFVIAVCHTASIATTTGLVTFDPKGRTMSRTTRPSGSKFTGIMTMTHAEALDVIEAVHSLAPPHHIKTTINGELLQPRDALREFEVTLPTEISDEDGRLKPSRRKTTVKVYEPRDGEVASLYEMGIPVVELDDRWHIDIGQKVPLNMDRDNTTPAYTRAVRAEVLNHCADLLTDEASSEKWVTEALADDRIEPQAIEAALDKRFGKKRVVFDPSDPEANKIAASQGFAVIPSRALPVGVAGKARDAGLVEPAGQVCPSPKPYGDDGPVRKTLPYDQWTQGMKRTTSYAINLAQRLIDVPIKVEIVNDQKCRNFGATYRPGHLELNLVTLGRAWFDHGPTEYVNALLLHEFAHHYSLDHLSSRFFEAIADLGARLAKLALDDPGFFKAYA